MHVRQVRSATTLVALLVAFTVSCSGGPAPGPDRLSPQAAAPTVQATAPAESSGPDGAREEPVEEVRDAFATLQATYHDGCTTPGNCAYFLNRVVDELDGLDKGMKADPQGPGHFKEPLAWTAGLRDQLGDDESFENLKKHQADIVGVRDKINKWMQGHPEDYR
jgi:hypothetical protein